MSKYINADAFKEQYLCCGYLPEMGEEEFDSFPAADVAEIKHGHWIYYPECGVTKCSVCHSSVEECVEYPRCMFCGAKIDEEDENA